MYEYLSNEGEPDAIVLSEAEADTAEFALRRLQHLMAARAIYESDADEWSPLADEAEDVGDLANGLGDGDYTVDADQDMQHIRTALSRLLEDYKRMLQPDHITSIEDVSADFGDVETIEYHAGVASHMLYPPSF